MFCGKCHAELPEGTVMCPECGAIIGEQENVRPHPVRRAMVGPTPVAPVFDGAINLDESMEFEELTELEFENQSEVRIEGESEGEVESEVESEPEGEVEPDGESAEETSVLQTYAEDETAVLNGFSQDETSVLEPVAVEEPEDEGEPEAVEENYDNDAVADSEDGADTYSEAEANPEVEDSSDAEIDFEATANDTAEIRIKADKAASHDGQEVLDEDAEETASETSASASDDSTEAVADGSETGQFEFQGYEDFYFAPFPTSQLDGLDVLATAPSASMSTELPVIDGSESGGYITADHDSYYLSGRAPVRQRRGKALVVGLVCVLVAGILGGFAYLAYDAGLIGTIDVPDVTGMSEADARTTLEEAGFSLNTAEIDVDDGVGTIVSLNPSAGASLKRGTVIEGEVGRARILPDVVGQQSSDARSALEEAGATNIKIWYEAVFEGEDQQPVAEDHVMAMFPEAGSAFRSDDRVLLTVSQPYTVPDVSSFNLEEAQAAIERAGLSYSVAWQDSELPAYTVLSTNPSAAERLEEGSEVLLLVSAPGAREETYLSDYLESSGNAISDYLEWKEWNFYDSASQDPIIEMWYKNDLGTLFFTPNPESAHFTGGWYESQLRYGGAVRGVRFTPTLVGAFADPQLSEDYLLRIAASCGFENPSDSCTNETISGAGVPVDVVLENEFIAVCGERDGYTWYACVNHSTWDGSYEVNIACAPTATYEAVDLGPYDMRLVNYLAYIDHYTG
ncbi:MAG: PASTA domain-containing protein [Atopobiaceae bacterium]|nr:PASTA domain-containing protein [Atopobiaceae bacterium]